MGHAVVSLQGRRTWSVAHTTPAKAIVPASILHLPRWRRHDVVDLPGPQASRQRECPVAELLEFALVRFVVESDSNDLLMRPEHQFANEVQYPYPSWIREIRWKNDLLNYATLPWSNREVVKVMADRDVVIAFVGKPHRIDDRGSQVLKSLKELGFDQYYQAEEVGWVLYLEGSTDLAILRALAAQLNHAALSVLERPFVCYVGNQPSRARAHFYGLQEAKPNLAGIAIYDRLENPPSSEAGLSQMTWKRRELENYLCTTETLLAFAEAQGQKHQGQLFGVGWRNAMGQAIAEIEQALAALAKPSPWGPDIKASDDFLDPLFSRFYQKLELPNLMRKTDYHELARFVPRPAIDAEISEKLDGILATASRAIPRKD